ncbi:hypothetical protein [Natronococcus pandeyae]|nr:hypothetical protein [Natronococcus pandeyae]
MSLDKHVADRRRFARLFGIDGELGSGLPIGGERDADTLSTTTENREDD